MYRTVVFLIDVRSGIGSLTDNAFDEVVLLCVLQKRSIIFQAPCEAGFDGRRSSAGRSL